MGILLIKNCHGISLRSNMELNEKHSYSRVAQILRGTVPSIKTIGFVTAENPMGEKLDDKENVERNKNLEKDIRRSNNYGYRKIVGKYGNIENPFLINNIERDVLQAFAKFYFQESYIYGFLSTQTNGETGMIFEYWQQNKDGKGNFELLSQRKIFVRVKDDAEDFYSEVKGRKFIIPFFDDEFKDAEWFGGNVIKKENITGQDYILNEIESLLEGSLDEKRAGYSRWTSRGRMWEMVRRLKESISI